MKEKIKELIAEIWPFALVLALLCACCMFGGCRSAREVPVMHDTTYVNNVVYKDRYVRDTSYVHDSTFVMIKGDTVWKERHSKEYVERTVHDTTSVHDTCYKYKEVPVEVEVVKRKLVWWPGVVLAIAAVAGLVFVYMRYTFKEDER